MAPAERSISNSSRQKSISGNGRGTVPGSLAHKLTFAEAGAPQVFKKGEGLASLARWVHEAQEAAHQPAAAETPPLQERDPAATSSSRGVSLAAHARQIMPSNRWAVATSTIMAREAAKQVRTSAKLKALQRTPHHTIIHRIKLLLDRLPARAYPEGVVAPAPPALVREPSNAAALRASLARVATLGRSQSQTASSLRAAAAAGSMPRPQTSAVDVRPPRPSNVVRRPNTAAAGPAGAMDEASMLEELSIILCFLNPFLARMPEDARTQLCSFLKMETLARDTVLWSQGEDISKFYLILSGVVEASVRKLGQRTKAILKKGHCFGEKAILAGESAQDTCIAGSTLVVLSVPKNDFLAVLEPYMEQEKKLIMEFLRQHVSAFRTMPRGLVTNLAQHVQQVQKNDGTQIDAADTNIYFVVSGLCHLSAVEKQVVGDTAREDAESSAEAAAPWAQRLGQSGPLAKVELRDGRVVGTLGRHGATASKRTVVSSKLLSELEQGDFFGGGSLLIGEGELQSALVVTAVGPVKLNVISLADFSRHATSELLRKMRDEVCFRLTYYHGRVGLAPVDAVVGHNLAALSAGAAHKEAAPKKAKHRPGKRKAPGRAAGSGKGSRAGDQGGDEDLTPAQRAVQHYSVLHREDEEVQLTGVSKAAGELERFYANGTPAERYSATIGAEGSSKKQHITNLLQQIFPEGITPLADKVARLERREAVWNARLGRFTGTVTVHMTFSLSGLAGAALQASTTAISTDATPRMGAAESAAAAAGDSAALQQMPAWQQRQQQQQQQAESSPEADAAGQLPLQHEAHSQRPQAASQGLYRPKRRHYGYGEKLAAAALWAAATGRGQSAQLRQCLTYSEIRLKALAAAQAEPAAASGTPPGFTGGALSSTLHFRPGTAEPIMAPSLVPKPSTADRLPMPAIYEARPYTRA